MQQFIQNLVSLWAVIDPIGSIPVFIAATAGLSAAVQRKIAFRAIIISFFLLSAFIVGGQIVLEAMEISLPSFQIAGGLVLLLFALTMIFGESKPEQEQHMAENKDKYLDISVYPLAVPSIASPGAMMAVVLATDNHRYSINEQLITFGAMATVLVATLVLMLLASPILKLIGNTGASIISRVMGLILASIAVESILTGIVAFFSLSV